MTPPREGNAKKLNQNKTPTREDTVALPATPVAVPAEFDPEPMNSITQRKRKAMMRTRTMMEMRMMKAKI
jgi:hypothetical protein